jgi:hypothetical protein
MTEKELIRRAIMGDKKAQKECTAKGIMLPCPFCGGKATMQQDITGRESYHVVCSNVKDMCNLIAGLPMWSESEEDALKVWNTRPAPPVGRCRECKCWRRNGSDWGSCSKWYTEDKVQAFMLEDDFCSNFKPREESR